MPLPELIRFITFYTLICAGYFIFICSRFLKTKDRMLLFDNISRITFVAGYITGGHINGLEHTIFGIVRNKTYRLVKKDKAKKIAFIILLTAVLIMYGLSFSDISTVFFIISNTINLTAIAFGKEQTIRLGTILAAVCNILAFGLVNNIAALTGEIVILIMTLISFIKNKGEQPDIKNTRTEKGSL